MNAAIDYQIDRLCERVRETLLAEINNDPVHPEKAEAEQLERAALVEAIAKAAGGYSEEPDVCSNCGDDSQMNLVGVNISEGWPGVSRPPYSAEDTATHKAWICDACGHAHVQRRRDGVQAEYGPFTLP